MIVTETERLKIREFESHDVQALSKILSDPDIMEFSSKGPLNEADTMGFIEWCIKSYQKYGYGQWAVIEKESGKLIGCCGLSHATVDEARRRMGEGRLAVIHHPGCAAASRRRQ